MAKGKAIFLDENKIKKLIEESTHALKTDLLNGGVLKSITDWTDLDSYVTPGLYNFIREYEFGNATFAQIIILRVDIEPDYSSTFSPKIRQTYTQGIDTRTRTVRTDVADDFTGIVWVEV